MSGPIQNQIIAVDVFPFSVGRHPENHLVIPDPKVSRKHFEFVKEGHEILVKDTGSTLGLVVNGQKKEKHGLKSGDEIAFGDSLFKVEIIFKGTSKLSAPPLQASNRFDSISKGKFNSQFELLKNFNTPTLFSQTAEGWMHETYEKYQLDTIQIKNFSYEAFEKKISRHEGALNNFQEVEISSDEIIYENKQSIFSKTQALFFYPDTKHSHFKFYCEKKLGFSVDVLERLSWVFFVLTGLYEAKQSKFFLEKMKNQFLKIKTLLPDHALDSLKGDELSDPEVFEKEITVLFLDIEGFTSLSERLSAKEISNLLNDFFQKMVTDLKQFNGDVNKFIGDALMALFIEDDPKLSAQNAVKAGQAMIETLKQFKTHLPLEKQFNIRIGINTGKAVVGHIGAYARKEFTAIGDQVNLASRIQGVSFKNTVSIGPKTAEYVQDDFLLEEIEGVKLKGKKDPVNIYRVLDKKS